MKFFNQEKKRVCYLPEHQNEIVKYFVENEDATLVVSFDDFILPEKPIDFDNVLEINIKKLMLSGSYHKTNELGAFLKLATLIELDNRNIELHYDFINFPNLEILRYTWQKKCLNISECKKLKELSLWSYKPKNQNLTEFSKLNSLDELRIIQSNIKSINGIENLQNIREMVFIANKLLSFDDMNCVFPNVEILHIESCKEIKIEKIIKLFPNIKDLNFFSSNEIESLRIILDNLKNLERLNVYNLKILENDNTYWKDYKNLKSFNFQDRKHHILKRKDFKNI
ncbi:hypothetical protein WFZ85_15670 [Flavobacterium sp. j3]|uniref:Leucine-rich repeat domain-containing protein n=1 Tax=Flavobacterium aureirubrum TaxID=3133147 RepID=A0ABU9N8L5_9FLAO